MKPLQILQKDWLIKILKKISSPQYPELDWIQVGITTRCNASCIYCPHSILRDSWNGKDLSLEAFKALLPAFSKARLIYLQGWGEPLLHPKLFEMLEAVKKQGCMAGLTSNANLLTTERLKKLVDGGLDFLSLSTAGIDKKNDIIRKGTSLRKVLKTIEEVNRIKSATGSSLPKVHLAHMLLRSGLGDLKGMPDFFNAAGVDQVVISGLTLAFTPEMEKEMYLADSETEFLNLKEKLLDMKNRVDTPEKIYFHLHNPYQSPGHCSENIHRATFMNVDGYIKPCVCNDFHGFHKEARMYIQGKAHLLPDLAFGNIREKALGEIWHGKDYSSFRKKFFTPEINQPCEHCAKRFIDAL
ncbi:MAG: radical SAM/SPASM domain-containing protein [Desulfopila sp.]